MSDLVSEFNTWVKSNYSGHVMSGPPEIWNPDVELYYQINELYYGPIKLEDIPKKFMEDK